MGRPRPSSRQLAVIADGLTGLRALLAVPLYWAAATETTALAAALLAVAWWSDFLDGRFARLSSDETRLGQWDLAFDTLVGSALLGGLISAGRVEALPWGLIGLGLVVGYLVLRNLALGMLVQALAYAFFLAEVWAQERAWLGMLIATIGAILVLDWRRFVSWVLPTFFAGVGLDMGTDTERPAELD